MFCFFLNRGLISANQSSFKLGDSYINQLLSITYNIYKSCDDLYIDKFWQDCLIFKLQENGISGNL